MPTNLLPHMSYDERHARATAKRELMLKFLSSEGYTTIAIAARVMSCSTSSAERTLAGLVKDGSLKTESHLVRSRKTRLYGITNQGLALSNEFENSVYFELGRTNSSFISHHIQTQLARLSAEDAGWTDWKPGKILYNKGLGKIPDAIVKRPDQRLVAIECELNIKSQKRIGEVIASHLQSITKGLWYEVHYLTSIQLKNALKRAFERIETVLVKGDRLALENKHRERFLFYSFDQWPPEHEDENPTYI